MLTQHIDFPLENVLEVVASYPQTSFKQVVV
uniref:Uncharacterized protein n=1 Tax=Arundo donax TaxID=35708 RepID=A0A0A9BMG1_ARUDO